MLASQAYKITRSLYVKHELRKILDKIRKTAKKGGFWIEVNGLLQETSNELTKLGYRVNSREKHKLTDGDEAEVGQLVISIGWANYEKWEEMEYDGTPVKDGK
jgi:hypothetical protein